MKKVRFCLVFCMILTLLFGACGTAQNGTEPTSAPEATESPAVTDATEVTVPAEDTEKITEPPAPTGTVEEVTKEPQPTETPEITETPVVTETPEVTDALKATATPKPTSTPKPVVTVYPKADSNQGDICYTADELEVLQLWNVECKLQANGKQLIQYTEQYGQIRFALPEAIDSSKCTGITIKMKAGTTWMGISFYGEGFIKRPFDDKTESYLVFNEIKDELTEHGVTIPDIGDVY